MKNVQPSLEERNISSEKPFCCSQCGWPGTGKMPAGVRLTKQEGKTVLVGRLSYFQITAVLCSLCQEMESAVASRPWFVEAQAEYLDQIKTKKQMLGIK
jgi:hypothetical protein